MTTPNRGEQRLALFAALNTTFAALHGLGDHWVQTSRDAVGKGAHGAHLVYADNGKPVADDPGRTSRTMTASAPGRATAVGNTPGAVSGAEMTDRMKETPMTTIGIIGAGEVGSQLARTAISHGYQVVIANSRAPETLRDLTDELGPSARAATAADAAEAGDFVIVAAPLKPVNTLPVRQLAGKIVLDTNNYMPWRDGHYRVVDSGEKTVHELRQDHLPASKVAKAFSHVQAPRLFLCASPSGTPGRHALSVSSDYPEAVELVTRLYDEFGFDTVDNSPLSQSWRSGPGQPAWFAHAHQTRGELKANLARARRIPYPFRG